MPAPGKGEYIPSRMNNRPKRLVVTYAALAALLYLVLLIPGPLELSSVGGWVVLETLVVIGLWRGWVIAWALALLFALGGAASTILTGGSLGAQAIFFSLVCLAQVIVLVLPSDSLGATGPVLIRRFLLPLVVLVSAAALVIMLGGWSDIGPRVPKGVSEIDVSAPIGRNVNHSRIRTWRITDRAQVKRVIGWFDSLQEVKPSVPDNGICYLTMVDFTFRSSNRSELATAGVPPGRADGCSPANITIGEQESAFFIDKPSGTALIDRVKHLLGAGFRPIVPTQN